VAPGQLPSAVAARALGGIFSVQPPGGAPQPVDNALLQRTLTAAEAEHDRKRRVARFEQAAAQIAALRAELNTRAVLPKDRSGRPAIEAARAVLGSAAYDFDPLPAPSPLERAVDWIARTIQEWLRGLHPARVPDASISPGFITAIWVVLGIAVFAVLVAVILQVIRRRAGPAAPLALDATEAVLVEARDTQSLRALAEQQAHHGDYRRAFRLIYLATLVALDTGGVLRFDRSKTNWEYLRTLRAAGREDLSQALTPLTRDFDRVWYGFAPASAADYARALAHYDALEAASPGPSVGASRRALARPSS
jgi:hypothetical protein